MLLVGSKVADKKRMSAWMLSNFQGLVNIRVSDSNIWDVPKAYGDLVLLGKEKFKFQYILCQA